MFKKSLLLLAILPHFPNTFEALFDWLSTVKSIFDELGCLGTLIIYTELTFLGSNLPVLSYQCTGLSQSELRNIFHLSDQHNIQHGLDCIQENKYK